MSGSLSDVFLLMNEALLIGLFEEIQSRVGHFLFAERGIFGVVRAIGLVVGLEVGHFYYGQRLYVTSDLSIQIITSFIFIFLMIC